MLYQDKYFDQDKNSILRAAQGFVEPQLLQRWVEIAFDSYMALENPMGLVDDFILRLKSIEKYDTSLLEELYEILAAIYRYEKGNNQLEIIWDGRSHYEVYAENWSESFEKWVQYFCTQPEIYRAILKACILQQGTNTKFLYYGMRKTILGHFNLRITRNKTLKTA
ncbi:hypothetical protein [Marinoscillum sp. 108]|jgi:hypothetical protein|uniref:Uncharacterized protein n=1 Tax=Marinoscillum luteum TaxID=861051 RepID=A0ABW7NDC9_9BACT|nr:hypothetical protein [Marinoscillum sp. 108]VXD13498.1 conserved hypothetical protein [Marinoscillum sp. 108]